MKPFLTDKSKTCKNIMLNENDNTVRSEIDLINILQTLSKS